MKSIPLREIGILLLVLIARPSAAQTNFTLLKSFVASIGTAPQCTLIRGTGGALYGTTSADGSSNSGTVFKINLDGSGFATIKNFTGTDGKEPRAGLIQGGDGALYGTTFAGGASNLGTVFKLSPNGSGYSVLHSFDASDGKWPQAPLIQGSDGFLYGSASSGGSSFRGVLFKLGTNGSGFLVLHTFTGGPDGQEPHSGLWEDTNGVLYGVAGFGGSVLSGGIVYKLNKDGNGYTMLHIFDSAPDGYRPVVELLEGSDGFLYGTTEFGGTNNVGTLFKIGKDGNGFAVLRQFLNIAADGQHPDCELTEGSDGALYGACTGGGPASGGSVFKLNKDGSGFTFLRRFTGNAGDADFPRAGLMKYGNGVFYGTTQLGGVSGIGCVYALSVDPFPPRALGLSVFAKSNVVQFAGTSAISYDLQRSTNLNSWLVLSNVTIPVNGIVSFTDTNPPASAGFYRLKQH